MTVLNQVENHSLYNTLNTYFSNLEKVENDEEFLASITEYCTATLNRVSTILNIVKDYINSIDPYLFRKVNLDNILRDLNNINSILINYKIQLNNDKNLNNINNLLDNIIANIATISPYKVNADFENIKESAISFRRAVGVHKALLQREQENIENKIKEIDNKFINLNDSFSGLQNAMEASLNKFKEQYDELHQKFIENQENRSTKFVEQLNNMKNEFDKKIKDFQNNLEEIKSSVEIKLQEKISDFESKFQTIIEQSEQKKDAYDQTLEQHKQQVENLVGIISTSSISGHYKKVADQKRTATIFWQIFTIISFIGTIGFGIYAFIFSDETIDWPSLISRIVVTGALGSLTGYSARQAAKNEQEQNYNRKIEVELKTLNPYIASFSSEEQTKLKEQLFPYIFGTAKNNNNNSENNSNTQSEMSTVQNPNTISGLIEILKNLTNKQ
jgi:hypothetical protein